MKQIDDSRSLFSLTVSEFVQVLRTVMEEQGSKEAMVVPLDSTLTADQEFTIEGLMDFLGCSKASVHNYKKRGLPFYRMGRKVLFRKEEVLAFMKDNRRKKSPPTLRRVA